MKDLTQSNTHLDLGILEDGVAPGLTSSVGKGLAEAASVCLAENNHDPGATTLSVSGDIVRSLQMKWEQPSSQTLNAHYDLQDATEEGACGIAIALMRCVRGQIVLRKAYKGRDKGFDYWLGAPGTEERLPFSEDDLRMEVSGILQGEESTLNQRLKSKTKQVQQSKTDIPGIAVVVMFSGPVAATQETNADGIS